jgi:hypothetical protein
MSSWPIADEVKDFCDIERLAGHDTAQGEKVSSQLSVDEGVCANQRPAAYDVIVTEQGAIGAQENLLDQCPTRQRILSALIDSWQRERIIAGGRHARECRAPGKVNMASGGTGT